MHKQWTTILFVGGAVTTAEDRGRLENIQRHINFDRMVLTNSFVIDINITRMGDVLSYQYLYIALKVYLRTKIERVH